MLLLVVVSVAFTVVSLLTKFHDSDRFCIHFQYSLTVVLASTVCEPTVTFHFLPAERDWHYVNSVCHCMMSVKRGSILERSC